MGPRCDREVPEPSIVHRDAEPEGLQGAAPPQGRRHGGDAAAPEPLLELRHQGRIAHQRRAEHLRHGVLRDVVLRGAEAAGHDHRAGAVTQGGNRCVSHFQVLTRGIVFGDVLLNFVAHSLVDGALSGNRRLTRGFPATPSFLKLAAAL